MLIWFNIFEQMKTGRSKAKKMTPTVRKQKTGSFMIMSVAPSPKVPACTLILLVLDQVWTEPWEDSWPGDGALHCQMTDPPGAQGPGGWKDCWCPAGTFCLRAVGEGAAWAYRPPPPYANRGLTVTSDDKHWGDGRKTSCQSRFIAHWMKQMKATAFYYLLKHFYFFIIFSGTF